MLLTQILIFTLCQAAPATKAKQLQVELGQADFHHSKLLRVSLNFLQAPKKGERVLVLVPASGSHAELVITGVNPSEIDGFDVALDLAPLALKADAKQEYSSQVFVAIYPAPAVVPALVSLNPATCPKMIQQSQVQACLDMDLDGKPDLLLAECCSKGYVLGQGKQVECNEGYVSQCLWRWQGKAWKLVYERGPC